MWHHVRGYELALACHAAIVSTDDRFAGLHAKCSAEDRGGPCAFVDPDSVVESAPSNYSSHTPIGRYEPVKTFINNQNRTVSFRVRFEATGFSAFSPFLPAVAARGDFGFPAAAGPSDVAALESIREEVHGPVIWLDSLTAPVPGSDGAPFSPPSVMLRISSFLTMMGVVTACNIRWGDTIRVPSGIYTGPRGLYMSADVDITVASNVRYYANGYNGQRRGQR
jgi:hypothetical protein